MYKRGLKLWSINTDFYYEKAKQLYKDNIFDYVELYIVPDSLDTLEKWKKFVSPLAPREGKLPFIIHCPHFAHGFNLAKKEKKVSNKIIYEQVKQFADELDAEYIIFHGGIDGEIEETAKQLASFDESRALIENKPYIALPNRMGGEFCRGFNIDEIKTVQDLSGCGFCLDFGHAICAANSKKLDVYEYCENFLQLNPNMFHLTDLNDITSPYDSHLHLGSGELDFQRIFNMIPKDSLITFETVKNSKENLDDFIEDMDFIKKFD